MKRKPQKPTCPTSVFGVNVEVSSVRFFCFFRQKFWYQEKKNVSLYNLMS